MVLLDIWFHPDNSCGISMAASRPDASSALICRRACHSGTLIAIEPANRLIAITPNL
jgi:hypothetical protein